MKMNSFWKMIPVAAFAAFAFVACDSGNSSDSNAAESSSSAAVSSSSQGTVDPSTVVTGTMTDPRDGQVYKMVTIGTQTWMAQNLNYAVDSSWCYENSADSCSKYGRLYQWAAAIGVSASYNDATFGDSVNHHGVCPAGWHLPTSGEWATLGIAVGGSDSAGEKLKSASGWYSSSGNGTDSYGFSALPAGYRSDDCRFYNAGDYANFWSATESMFVESEAYYMYLGYYLCTYTVVYDKNYAVSVRCVHD